MNETRFDRITRSLVTEQSRRALVRRWLVPGAVTLGAAMTVGTGLPDAAAAKRLCRKSGSRCRKLSKRCKAKFCRTASPIPQPPPGPGTQFAFQCPGPSEIPSFNDGSVRGAQVFAASRSGALSQITVDIRKDSGTDDYVLQLVKVINGVPSPDALDVLAEVMIPNGAVPLGDATLTGSFAGPNLVAGTDYAVVVSRPGPSGFTVHLRQGGGDCGGLLFGAIGEGPFIAFPALDLISSVVVA